MMHQLVSKISPCELPEIDFTGMDIAGLIRGDHCRLDGIPDADGTDFTKMKMWRKQ